MKRVWTDWQISLSQNTSDVRTFLWHVVFQAFDWNVKAATVESDINHIAFQWEQAFSKHGFKRSCFVLVLDANILLVHQVPEAFALKCTINSLNSWSNRFLLFSYDKQTFSFLVFLVFQRLIETAPWGDDPDSIEQQLIAHQKYHSSIQRSPEVDRAKDDLVGSAARGKGCREQKPAQTNYCCQRRMEQAGEKLISDRKGCSSVRS